MTWLSDARARAEKGDGRYGATVRLDALQAYALLEEAARLLTDDENCPGCGNAFSHTATCRTGAWLKKLEGTP